MKKIFTILSILFLAISCSTLYWIPEFEDKEEFHYLGIPTEGKTYDIPFKFSYSYHGTRTSITEMSYQIRGRFLFDGIPGEIFDTYIKDNPIQWNWSGRRQEDGAIMHVHIPANESSEARSVVVQISIDNIAHINDEIKEDDDHDWDEWVTILDGIQAGQ